MNAEQIKSGVEVIKEELEELAEKYVETKNDCYFNILWDRVKAFSISVGKKFVTIPYEDRQSIAMEVLFRCLPKVQNGKGKLLTYYGFALRCEYVSWLEKCETYKYKVNAEAYSLEKMEEDVNFQPIANIDEFNMDLFYDTCNLLGAEAIMVSLLYEGYDKNEIMVRMSLEEKDFNSIFNLVKDKIRNNYLEDRGFTM